MLNAPPLENSRSFLYGRANSLPRSESLVTTEHLPRKTSGKFDPSSSSRAPDFDRFSTYRASPAGLAAAPSQRQLSGGMASTSYLQPVQINGQQHSSSVFSQPLSSHVIELDDDSPLPMRRRHQRHANTFSSSRHHNGNLQHQNSGSLVDLTGSPPVVRPPIRHSSNRIDLDSIGSGSLRRSSSDLGNQHTRDARPQQQRQQQAQSSGLRHTACDAASAPSLYRNTDGLQCGRLGSHANDTSGASNSMFSHDTGDFLDVSGLQLRQYERNNTSSSLRPIHRSSVTSPRGHEVLTHERRSAFSSAGLANRASNHASSFLQLHKQMLSLSPNCLALSAQACRTQTQSNLWYELAILKIVNCRATPNQVPAELYGATAWPDVATQEDMDLALGELLPLSSCCVIMCT